MPNPISIKERDISFFDGIAEANLAASLTTTVTNEYSQQIEPSKETSALTMLTDVALLKGDIGDVIDIFRQTNGAEPQKELPGVTETSDVIFSASGSVLALPGLAYNLNRAYSNPEFRADSIIKSISTLISIGLGVTSTIFLVMGISVVFMPISILALQSLNALYDIVKTTRAIHQEEKYFNARVQFLKQQLTKPEITQEQNSTICKLLDIEKKRHHLLSSALKERRWDQVIDSVIDLSLVFILFTHALGLAAVAAAIFNPVVLPFFLTYVGLNIANYVFREIDKVKATIDYIYAWGKNHENVLVKNAIGLVFGLLKLTVDHVLAPLGHLWNNPGAVVTKLQQKGNNTLAFFARVGGAIFGAARAVGNAPKNVINFATDLLYTGFKKEKPSAWGKFGERWKEKISGFWNTPIIKYEINTTRMAFFRAQNVPLSHMTLSLGSYIQAGQNNKKPEQLQVAKAIQMLTIKPYQRTWTNGEKYNSQTLYDLHQLEYGNNSQRSAIYESKITESRLAASLAAAKAALFNPYEFKRSDELRDNLKNDIKALADQKLANRADNQAKRTLMDHISKIFGGLADNQDLSVSIGHYQQIYTILQDPNIGISKLPVSETLSIAEYARSYLRCVIEQKLKDDMRVNISSDLNAHSSQRVIAAHRDELAKFRKFNFADLHDHYNHKRLSITDCLHAMIKQRNVKWADPNADAYKDIIDNMHINQEEAINLFIKAQSDLIAADPNSPSAETTHARESIQSYLVEKLYAELVTQDNLDPNHIPDALADKYTKVEYQGLYNQLDDGLKHRVTHEVTNKLQVKYLNDNVENTLQTIEITDDVIAVMRYLVNLDVRQAGNATTFAPIRPLFSVPPISNFPDNLLEGHNLSTLNRVRNIAWKRLRQHTLEISNDCVTALQAEEINPAQLNALITLTNSTTRYKVNHDYFRAVQELLTDGSPIKDFRGNLFKNLNHEMNLTEAERAALTAQSPERQFSTLRHNAKETLVRYIIHKMQNQPTPLADVTQIQALETLSRVAEGANTMSSAEEQALKRYLGAAFSQLHTPLFAENSEETIRNIRTYATSIVEGHQQNLAAQSVVNPIIPLRENLQHNPLHNPGARTPLLSDQDPLPTSRTPRNH